MDGLLPARVPQEVTTFSRGWGGMASGSDLFQWGFTTFSRGWGGMASGSDLFQWGLTAVIACLVLVFILNKALGLKIWARITRPGDRGKVPDGIKQRNNYVWELYSPEGRSTMDIVFFHGLQLGDFEHAFWKTWQARNDKDVIWPRKWLSEIYPQARIFSISYNSCAQKCKGQLDMYALGENLVSDIIMDRRLHMGQGCPVFLVGHSLGGLVIKQLIISAFLKKSLITSPGDMSRMDAFLRKFKGVYYYATPHEGSRIADLARYIPFRSPMLELLKTLDTQRARINAEFASHRNKLEAKSEAMMEGLPLYYRAPYTMFRFSDVVVEEASARHDVDNFYSNTEANHITVCKAEKKDSAVITKLTEFINENRG